MATFEPKKSFPNIPPKEVILMAYQKKFLFGANGPATQLWIHCKDCFTILPNKRGQERHGNYVNGFSERNLIQSNLVILEQKWYDVLLTLNLLPGFFIRTLGPVGGSYKIGSTGLPRLLKLPQISSNLKFLLKSPLISSKNVDFQENLLNSAHIQKIENPILAISLLNNTNNLSVRAVNHNCIVGRHGNISLYCLIVYLLKYSIIWSLWSGPYLGFDSSFSFFSALFWAFYLIDTFQKKFFFPLL